MPESIPPPTYEDFTLYEDDEEVYLEYTVNPLDKIHYPIRQQADVDEIERLTRQLDAARDTWRYMWQVLVTENPHEAALPFERVRQMLWSLGRTLGVE